MIEPKALVIVEGKDLESSFFKRLFRLFKIKNRIYKVETNIYALYKRMETYDFDVDIKKVLLEMHPEHKKLLNHNFAYTYLVFDCDVHHTEYHDARPYSQIINDNFDRLKKMISYFDNETDPTVGKMYINYPMMESFRFCDCYFDENYKDCYINLEEFKGFKSKASKKKLSSKHLDKITKRELTSLILLNVFKLNYLMTNNWSKLTYLEYLQLSDGKKVLLRQDVLKNKTNKIAILNTSLFLIIDYFGDSEGFYSHKLKKHISPNKKRNS